MDTNRREFMALGGLGFAALALGAADAQQARESVKSEGGKSLIIITGKADVSAENRAAFLPIGERQVTNSRLEPGCLSYAYYEDVMTPGRFFFYEEWKDQAAVDFHFKQPYCLEFIAKARALASSPPEIKIRHVTE